MPKNTKVVFDLVVNDEDFKGGINEAIKSVGQFAIGLGSLTAGVGILKDLGTEAVNLALDFDETAAKVSTLFGDVDVDENNLNQAILELSNSTGIAATELNEGLYSALSAGIPVTEDMGDAMDFLSKATELSIAGFTSTEKAVDVATTVMNAYGLTVKDTDHIMNTLIETQNAGKTTVDELASSLGNVIPSAAAAGVSFDDLSAAMAVMTANGINTAQASTQLKALFSSMLKPSSDLNKEFKKISGETMPEYIKNGHTLDETLITMNDGLKKQGKEWGALKISTEASSAAMTLTKDGGDALTETFGRLTDDTSELAGAVEKMQTPQMTLNKLQQSWNNALIDTGNSILTVLQPALNWMADNMSELAPIIITATGALGTFLVVGGGLLIIPPMIGAITSAVKVMGVAFSTLGKSIMANPIGLAIAAGSALAIASISAVTKATKEANEAQEQLETDIQISRLKSEEQFWAENQEIQEVALRNKNKKIGEWSQEDLNVLDEYQAKKREQIKAELKEEEDLRTKARGEEKVQEAKDNNEVLAIKLDAYADYEEAHKEYRARALEANNYYNEVTKNGTIEMTEAQKNHYREMGEDVLALENDYNQKSLEAQGAFGVDSVEELQKQGKAFEDELNTQYEGRFNQEKKSYSDSENSALGHYANQLANVEEFNNELLSKEELRQLAQFEQSDKWQKLTEENTDASLSDLITLYQKKYGEIPPNIKKILSKTDFSKFVNDNKKAGADGKNAIVDESAKTKTELDAQHKKWGPFNFVWRWIHGDDEESAPSKGDSGGGGKSSGSKSSAPTPQTQGASIPQFAEGGIVDGGPGGIHAIVGEAGPEMILPLNNQGKTFLQQSFKNIDGGKNTTIEKVEINLTGVQDPDEFIQEINERLGDLL